MYILLTQTRARLDVIRNMGFIKDLKTFININVEQVDIRLMVKSRRSVKSKCCSAFLFLFSTFRRCYVFVHMHPLHIMSLNVTFPGTEHRS